MSNLVKLFFSLFLVFSTSGLYAAEVEPTPEKMKAWVTQLGDETFNTRQSAEKALAKAGVKAQALLEEASKNSKDAQVLATVKKLLGKLRFINMGHVDYFDIFPEKCLVTARINNIGDSWKNLQNTALGKLSLSKGFEPLRVKIIDAFEKGKKDGDPEKLFELLTRSFNGQAAVALLEFNPMVGAAKAALIIEVSEGDPQEIFNAILVKSNQKIAPLASYKDVQLYVNPKPNDEGVEFAIGKNLVVTSDEDSAKLMIDRFIANEKTGFNLSPSFVKTKAALGVKSDLTVSIDFMEFLKPFMPFIAMGVPGFDDILKSSGMDNVKLTTYSGNIAGDSFEERLVVVTDGPMTGLMDATVSEATDAEVTNVLNIIPANAVAAGYRCFDGEKGTQSITDYLAAVQKMQAGMNNANGVADPFAAIAIVEAKLGIKLSDFLSALKGPMASWIVTTSPPSLTPPDVGGFLTFVDEAQAKAKIETLVQVANKLNGKEIIKAVPYKTYTLYQLDLLAVAGTAVKLPYPTPSMVVVGKRVFLSTSSEALQKQLNNMDVKAPGILSNPEFVKATVNVKADERKVLLMYVDLKPLLVLGGNVGLPILAATTPDAEARKFIAGLPPAADLFKEITPLVVTFKKSNDHAVLAIRSPLPGSVTYAGIIAAVVAYQQQKELQKLKN